MNTVQHGHPLLQGHPGKCHQRPVEVRLRRRRKPRPPRESKSRPPKSTQIHENRESRDRSDHPYGQPRHSGVLTVKLTINVEAPDGHAEGHRPALEPDGRRKGSLPCSNPPRRGTESHGSVGSLHRRRQNLVAVGAGTEHGTTETLTVTAVSTSESGYEYRAAFKNSLVESPVLQQRSHPDRRIQSGARRQRKSRTRSQRKSKNTKPPKKPRAQSRRRNDRAGAAKASEEAAAAAAKRAQEEAEAKQRTKTTAATPGGSCGGSQGDLRFDGQPLRFADHQAELPSRRELCSGTITLKTASAVSASAKQSKATVLTLASARFSIAGGQVKAVTLRLSSAGAQAARTYAHGADAGDDLRHQRQRRRHTGPGPADAEGGRAPLGAGRLPARPTCSAGSQRTACAGEVTQTARPSASLQSVTESSHGETSA